MCRTTAKIWITVACSIILLHAFVPHHHHDCCGESGLVFENELVCHCDCNHEDCHHHDGESRHPYNTCRLQDLLSHLVLTHKDDESALLPTQSGQVVTLWGSLQPALPEIMMTGCALLPDRKAVRLHEGIAEPHPSRGPPAA